MRVGSIFLAAMMTITAVVAGAAEFTWGSDYKQALKTAAADKKKVFLFFSASDWCPSSQELEKNILSTPEFKVFAAASLIGVKIDFPKNKILLPIQRQMNEELQEKFGVEGYPTIIILDEQGKLLGEMEAENETPAEFIARVKMVMKNPPQESPKEKIDSDANAVYHAIKFPSKDKAKTEDEYNKQLYTWIKSMMVDQPLTKGEIKQQEADWLTVVLKYYCDLGDLAEAKKFGASGRLMYEKEGYDSPYFLATLLWFYGNHDQKFYKILNRKTREKMATAKNLPMIARMIYAAATQHLLLSLLEKGISNGDFDKMPPQVAFRMLTRLISEKDLPAAVVLLGKSQVDPWVLKMLNAKLKWSLAWQQRGGDYAYTVTQNGWKGFDEYGQEAYKEFKDAWTMHQDFPEAAGALIDVSNGTKGLQESLSWFNRAIAAQVDYRSAYVTMLWALRPRWHGSWEMMVAFGRKAADIDDSLYHTMVPLVFIWEVQDVVEDMSSSQPSPPPNRLLICQREFLRKQFPEVKKVLDRKIAIAEKNGNRQTVNHLRAILAKHQLECGDFAAAYTNMKAMTAPDEGREYGCRCPMFITQPCSEMWMEAQLGNGLRASELKEISQLLDQGEFDLAGEKCFQLSTMPSNNQYEKTYLENKAIRCYLVNRCIDNNVPVPIFCLASHGSIAGVKVFLDSGVKVEIKDKDNCSLLQHSLQIEWDRHGSDMEKDKYAASKIAMLKFLMSRGADIKALGGPQWTTLHLTISNKLPVAVTAFVLEQKGGDINAGDVDGETPLIWCAMLDLTDHAKFLLEHGANVNATTKSGATALDRVQSDNMRKLLIDNGGKHSSELSK